MHTPEHALQEVAQFFNHLAPSDLDRLHLYYTEDAFFKDPFNEVRGLSEIRRIFAHMFESLTRPRFVITQSVQQGAQCFVTWDFIFGLSGRADAEITVRGASHLVLQEDAGQWRIAMHRDYWDVAEELYEKLPVLGSLMRWLKRRVNS
jgi:ketosteroid isomerase-like protein